MRRFLLVSIVALFSTAGFASGGQNRLGDVGITEVYQLCDQLGVEDGATITVEQCANVDHCVVVKVDCSLHDEDEG